MTGTAQNRVEIDPAALAAEADMVSVPDAPAAPGAADASTAGEPSPGDPSAPAAEMSFAQAAAAAAPLAAKLKPVIDRTAARILPAWNLTEAERSGLADDIALCMVLWAPSMDALPPKWLALVSLGMSVYAITDARRDTEGNLLPRAVVNVGRGASNAPASAASAGEKNKTAGGSGFATSA